MTRLPDRFIEDRRLRDDARAVLTEDIARLRATLAQQGVAGRVSSSIGTTITGRIRSGAGDLLAEAKTQVSDHKGVLALLIGAILLWFARGPILALLDPPEDADPDAPFPQPRPADPATEPMAAHDGDPE